MAQSSAHNQPSFAERYETVLVSTIFRPWAREMIQRAAPQDGDHILDLACGTGAVTREIATSGISPASLTAVDHSAAMLNVARGLAAEAGVEADWVEADAGNLPLPDDCFDLAICQQALQFFPDRAGALCELRRVLRKGGKAAFCVQRELAVNPMLRSQAAALDKYVGPEAGDSVRAICGLPDADEIRVLFEDAGFTDVAVETVSLDLHHPDGRVFAAGAMGGMHTGDKLSRLSQESREQAIDYFLAELGECFDGNALRFPHVSNVAMARA